MAFSAAPGFKARNFALMPAGRIERSGGKGLLRLSCVLSRDSDKDESLMASLAELPYKDHSGDWPLP